MRRHITLRRAGDGEDQPLMTRQQRLLNRRQYLIGVAVETGLKLRRLRPGNRLILTVEQILKTDPPLLDIRLEPRRNLTRTLTRQVIDALVIVIQTDFGQAFADGFRLPFHLHSGLGQASGLLIADRQITAHLLDGLEQTVELLAIGFRATGDFTDLSLYARRQPRDVFQMLAGVLDLLDAGLQITGQLADLLHHLRRTLLNVGNHLPDLAGRRGSPRCQTAHLVRYHRKSPTMLARPRRFNRCVEGQQIGLAGDRLNHQSHPLNVVAAQTQGFDQLTASVGALTELMHARNRIHQFGAPRRAAVMRLAGGVQRFTTELRSGVFSGDHHFGVADNLRRRVELRFEFARQLLDGKRHTGG